MNTHYKVKKDRNNILKIKTADYTILPNTEDMWAKFSNLGASGAVEFQLPPAEVGMGFRFLVQVAQALQIQPASGETIALPSTGAQGTADKYIVADAVGEMVELECKIAGDWDVNSYIGTWTAEA